MTKGIEFVRDSTLTSPEDPSLANTKEIGRVLPKGYQSHPETIKIIRLQVPESNVNANPPAHFPSC